MLNKLIPLKAGVGQKGLSAGKAEQGLLAGQLSAQESRRLLRIAFGACIGFTVCKVMNWPYGVFFTVFPILLLGMLPVFNLNQDCQFVASVVINVVEMFILKSFFAHSPILMTLGVLFVFGMHFRYMARSSNALMWTMGVVSLSVMLHFSSYPATSLTDMAMATFLGCGVAIISAALLYWLLPDIEPVNLPTPPTPSPAQVNHRMLMGAVLATLSFMAFQILDLKGSLSAQVATVLVLFPMTLQGTATSALKRAKGVAFGCALAIVIQILMYDLIQYLPLAIIALFMCVLITARLHIVERAGSGMGFGALTTVGILFGQYLQPNADLLYSAMYRFSSVVVALGLLIVLAYWLDKFLNLFALTRNH